MKHKVTTSKKIENQFEVLRTFMAIMVAIVLALGLISLVSENPFEAMNQFLIGPFMSVRSIGNIIELTIPLIFTGLAVCIMFQGNQFNMAAEGAFFIGGLASSYIATRIALPVGIHPIFGLLFGAVVGAIVCGIPAVLKVKWGANEVVSSLMLNYIMLFFGSYILNYFLLDPGAGYPATDKFIKTAKLGVIIPGTRVHAGLIIAIIMIILSYLFIYRTRWGYAIRMTGQNENFAKYSGISVGATIILAQIVGGAIAGMGGATEVLGMYKRFSWVTLPGYGFDGIIIAILARNNPVYVPLAAVFLAYLRIGADIMARRTDVAPELVGIVQAMIILLVAAKMLLDRYKHQKIVKNSQRQLELKGEM